MWLTQRMNLVRKGWCGVLATGLVLGWAARASGGAYESMVDTSATIYDHLQYRLEIGVRATYFTLMETSNPEGFVGSITQLEADQSSFPFHLFFIYNVNAWWGVELTFDDIRAAARNGWNGDSDGTYRLRGPVLSVFGRYPNASRWTPYAGLGFGYFSGTFEDEAWWGNHYQSKQG